MRRTDPRNIMRKTDLPPFTPKKMEHILQNIIRAECSANFFGVNAALVTEVKHLPDN